MNLEYTSIRLTPSWFMTASSAHTTSLVGSSIIYRQTTHDISNLSIVRRQNEISQKVILWVCMQWLEISWRMVVATMSGGSPTKRSIMIFLGGIAIMFTYIISLVVLHCDL